MLVRHIMTPGAETIGPEETLLEHARDPGRPSTWLAPVALRPG